MTEMLTVSMGQMKQAAVSVCCVVVVVVWYCCFLLCAYLSLQTLCVIVVIHFTRLYSLQYTYVRIL